MRVSNTLLVLAFLAGQFAAAGLGAGRVEAAELQPALGFSAGYSSNPFGRKPSRDFFSVRANPRLRLVEEAGRLTYDVTSLTSYAVYIDDAAADFLDHTTRLRGRYAIGPRTQIEVQDAFDRTQGVSFERQDGSVVTNINDIELTAQRLYRNQAQFTLDHLFTPRVSAQLSGGHYWLDFDDKTQVDSQSMDSSASLSYAWTERTRIGLGGGYTRQVFDDPRGTPFVFDAAPLALLTQRRETTISNSWQAFATLSHRFDPTLSFQLQAGPAFVSQETRSARFFDANPALGVKAPTLLDHQTQQSDSITYFGTASVTKRMRRWQGHFAYTRRQSQAGGDSVVTGVDRIRMTLGYGAEVWNAFFQLGWNHRERIVERADGDSFGNDRQQFVVATGYARRLSRRLSVNLGADYRFQERQIGGSTQNWTVTGALQYQFNPIDFDFLP